LKLDFFHCLPFLDGLFNCSLIRGGLCLLWGEQYRILRASVLNLDLQIILTLK
jgi:hypothetical protein